MPKPRKKETEDLLERMKVLKQEQQDAQARAAQLEETA